MFHKFNYLSAWSQEHFFTFLLINLVLHRTILKPLFKAFPLFETATLELTLQAGNAWDNNSRPFNKAPLNKYKIIEPSKKGNNNRRGIHLEGSNVILLCFRVRSSLWFPNSQIGLKTFRTPQMETRGMSKDQQLLRDSIVSDERSSS